MLSIKEKYPAYSRNVKFCGVYVIKHIKSNKIYVGSTDDLGNRRLTHQSSLRLNKSKNKPLQDAYNDDPNIEFILFIITDTREQAFDEEQKLLNHYKDSGLLFNIAKDARGSQKGIPLPSWHALKLIEAARNRVDSPETTKRKSLSHLGKKLSEEHKLKIGLAGIGRKDTLQASINKKLSARSKYKPILIEGVEYESMTAAADVLKIRPSAASNRVRSTLPKYKNWIYKPI